VNVPEMRSRAGSIDSRTPPPLREDGDEALMLRYRQGDRRAFEVLLQRHQRALHAFILRFVGGANMAQAEDLAQETFLRVVKHAHEYEHKAKFTTWLYTLARNLCIDATRRGRYRQAQSLDAPDEEGGGSLLERTADEQPSLDRRVMGCELKGRLRQAIASLPDDQREVFLMREVADLQFKEIAAVVGVPENTVKSRMRYALEKLREALGDYAEMARAVP